MNKSMRKSKWAGHIKFGAGKRFAPSNAHANIMKQHMCDKSYTSSSHIQLTKVHFRYNHLTSSLPPVQINAPTNKFINRETLQ